MPALVRQSGPAMLAQFESWKVAVERLRSAEDVDWEAAARLVAEIERSSTEPMLRQATSQAIPILRHAARDDTDDGIADAARRRLALLVDVLQDLSLPRFGKRGAPPKPLSAEGRARKMLGLPLDMQLACSDIEQAYRRAAKTAHPDAGGNEHAFLELAAARDTLMHPGAKRDA